MDGSSDLAGRRVGATARLEGAAIAVGLGRSITDGVVGRIVQARRREDAAIALQLDAARAAIQVGLAVINEVAAREGPVDPLGLVDDRDVRFDASRDQPFQRLRRAVGRVGGKPLRLKIVPVARPDPPLEDNQEPLD